MDNSQKSFRLPGKYRKTSRKEYGRFFWIGILGGYALNFIGLGLVGSALFVVGLISGIIWFVLTIKAKIQPKVIPNE